MKSTPLHVLLQSLVQEKKILNIGTKMPYLSALGSNFEKLLSHLKLALSRLCVIPYLGIFELKFENNIVNFEIRAFKCLTANFRARIKILELGIKNTWMFWAAILKNYCHIWSKRSWICLITKFGTKLKIPKFGNKNAWSGYF